MTSTEDCRRKVIRSLETGPLRTCRSHLTQDCALCSSSIFYGELYVNRGAGRVAHYRCVPGLGRAREPWQVEELHLSIGDDGRTDRRAGLSRFAEDDDEV